MIQIILVRQMETLDRFIDRGRMLVMQAMMAVPLLPASREAERGRDLSPSLSFEPFTAACAGFPNYR